MFSPLLGSSVESVWYPSLAGCKHNSHPFVLAATIMPPTMSMAAAKKREKKDAASKREKGTKLNFNLVMSNLR
jgi:hypothetical protein